MKDTLNKYAFTLETLDGEAVAIEYSLPTLRKIPEYIDNGGDDAALLEYICKKEEGWADQFTDDSVYKLLDQVGEQMNPRKAAWLKRQAAKIAQITKDKAQLGLKANGSTGSASKLPLPPVGNQGGSPT
jgi:hypothetical protein